MSNSASTLPDKPALSDYQGYIAQVIKDRGFDHESLSDIFLLLMEECGELAKAARKTAGIKSGAHSKEHNAAHEAADVFIHLMTICNALNIDLEKAFREKEEINKMRWGKEA